MVYQLRTAPVRATPTAIAGRILFALALVVGVLVAIPAVVALLTAIWTHAGLVLITGVVLIGLMLTAIRLLKRRS